MPALHWLRSSSSASPSRISMAFFQASGPPNRRLDQWKSGEKSSSYQGRHSEIVEDGHECTVLRSRAAQEQVKRYAIILEKANDAEQLVSPPASHSASGKKLGEDATRADRRTCANTQSASKTPRVIPRKLMYVMPAASLSLTIRPVCKS
jgi:hypothetical protein